MKVLIADDHALVREGIQHVLNRLNEDVEIFQASDFNEAVDIASQHKHLDLLLMDLDMPGMQWSVAIKKFQTIVSDTPIVVLSASDNPADVHAAIELGARGYIPKTSSNQVMLLALELVLSGSTYLPPELLHRTENSAVNGSGLVTENTRLKKTSRLLTPRQREVLQLLAEGKTNKEIGNALGLSDGTVRTHLATIFRLLQVTNRTQAVLLAVKLGLVDSTNDRS